MKLPIRFLGAGVLSFALLSPQAGAFTASRPARAVSAEETLIALMNRERAANGLQPLHLNLSLALAARDRADDMIAKHYFAHVAPDGTQPWIWVDKRGYDYTEAGENLAVGYRGEAVVIGWMHSPEHRENVLKPEFDEVGVAIMPESPSKPFRGPLVVALYGTRAPRMQWRTSPSVNASTQR